MENKPTLEEVKEYFKNAEKVKDPITKEEINLSDYHNFEIGIFKDTSKDVYINHKLKISNRKCLYCADNGYAEILTYKGKTFTITESQVRELIEVTGFESKTNNKLKDFFPEIFQIEVKLEVGKWYKASTSLFCYQQSDKSFGFTNGIWSKPTYWIVEKKSVLEENWNPVEATEAEVLEALKNEAVKRGFVSPCIYKPTAPVREDIYVNGEERWGFIFDENKLLLNNYRVFHKGVWAEIMPTITKSEAEKQLNKKIID